MSTLAERKPARVAPSIDPRSYLPAVVGGLAAALINGSIYLIVTAVGLDMSVKTGASTARPSLSLGPIFVASFVSAFPAQWLYFTIERWTQRPAREFMLSALVVWAVSLIVPAAMTNVSVSAGAVVAVMQTVTACSISLAILQHSRLHSLHIRAEVQ